MDSLNKDHYIVDGELKAHRGLVTALRFSAGGDYFLSASADRSIRLWNYETKNLVQNYEAHGWEVADVAISPDSKRFASCGREKAVVLWDIDTITPFRRYSGHYERVNTVAFNSDGSVLLSGSSDSTVCSWDLKSKSRNPIQIFTEAKDSITCVLSIDFTITTASVDGHVRSYDIRMGSLVSDCIGPPVTCVSISKDKRMMLVSSLDNSVRLFDTVDGTLLKTFTGLKNEKYKVHSCFDHKDTRVISGSEDGIARFWNISSPAKAEQNCLELEIKSSSIVSVASNPKAKSIITGDNNGTIRYWI